MRNTLKLIGATALLAACAALLLPGQALAQEKGDDVVKQVLAAWAKRRAAMKTVRYTIEGTETFKKGLMTRKKKRGGAHPRLSSTFPEKDVSFEKSMVVSFDFTTGRFRNNIRDFILNSKLGLFRKHAKDVVFDGTNTTIANLREENTSSEYSPGSRNTDLALHKGAFMTIMAEIYPVFFAHGYQKLYRSIGGGVGWQTEPLNPKRFRYQDKGLIGKRECVVIRSLTETGRSHTYDEFWVDLERDGAVLRWLLVSKGQTGRQMDIEYQELKGNWLPLSWRYDVLTGRREQMKVTKVEMSPAFSISDFTVTKKHGMNVSDVNSNQSFVIGSDNATLVPPGKSTFIWMWWHWLGLVTLGGCVLGAAYLGWRRLAVR